MRIGGRYGKALSLMKKGKAEGAFQIASGALEEVRQLGTSDPLAVPLRVSVTVLFAQLAVQLGRATEARHAAEETLKVYTEMESKVAAHEPLRREIEKLEYYARRQKE